MKRLSALLLSITLSATQVYAAQPLHKLRVLLDWFPNPDHAPLVVAQQQGFFKQQGLEVELIGPADPNDPPKLVAAKQADIAITYEPHYMQQVDHGLPLARLGTLIDKPLNCIVALKESGIKSLADLKGKKIGISAGDMSHSELRMLLEKQGLSLSDVQLVSVKYNLAQALLAYHVDAVTGVMRNFEVPQIEAKGKKVVVFFPEEYGVPNYSELIFIIHQSRIHDQHFQHFLTAIREAVQYIDEHPNESWQQFAKAYPAANNQVNRDVWFATMPYFAEEPALFNENEWRTFAGFMKQYGMIKNTHTGARYAVAIA